MVFHVFPSFFSPSPDGARRRSDHGGGVPGGRHPTSGPGEERGPGSGGATKAMVRGEFLTMGVAGYRGFGEIRLNHPKSYLAWFLFGENPSKIVSRIWMIRFFLPKNGWFILFYTGDILIQAMNMDGGWSMDMWYFGGFLKWGYPKMDL